MERELRRRRCWEDKRHSLIECWGVWLTGGGRRGDPQPAASGKPFHYSVSSAAGSPFLRLLLIRLQRRRSEAPEIIGEPDPGAEHQRASHALDAGTCLRLAVHQLEEEAIGGAELKRVPSSPLPAQVLSTSRGSQTYQPPPPLQQAVAPEYAAGVLQAMRQLREQGLLCDVVVRSGSMEVRAHRLVLAACSEYFRACLAGVSEQHGRGGQAGGLVLTGPAVVGDGMVDTAHDGERGEGGDAARHGRRGARGARQLRLLREGRRHGHPSIDQSTMGSYRGVPADKCWG